MSLIIYLSFLLLTMVLIKLYERIPSGNNIILFLLIWVIICIFGILRYDVGNDYKNYVYMFWDIYESSSGSPISLKHFLYDILSKIFSFTKYGYIAVLGIYYIFTITLILLVLKKNNILFWGFFTFVTWGLLFDSFDRVRQVAALAVFISSLSDIKENRFKIFFIKIILASLIHFSAIVLLPLYFMVKIKLNKTAMLLILLILLFGHYLNLWTPLVDFLYRIVPYYNKIYAGTKYNTQSLQVNPLLVLGITFFVYLNIIFSPVNYKYKTLLFYGLTLYLIGIGNLNIQRISDYILSSIIITFPMMIKHFKKIENKIAIITPLIFFLLIFFIKTNNQKYFSYQTIFSENFHTQYLKNRDYSN